MSQPKFVGLFEMEWYEFIEKSIREHGGILVESTLLNAIIFKNDNYWGTPKDLVKWMQEKYAFSLPTNLEFFEKKVEKEYKTALNRNERTHVYLGIKLNEIFIGYLVFMLYSDLLPITCENFRCLCTGEKGFYKGVHLSYKGTKLFRIAKSGWIQGGELMNSQGQTSCIYGKRFSDESYCIPKDRRGILCMANIKKNFNASQFAILLNPHEWANNYNVAFGQLIEGAHILKKIENLNTHYERIIDEVIIENCGVISSKEPIYIYPVIKTMFRTTPTIEKIQGSFKYDGIGFDEVVWRTILQRSYEYLGKREEGGLMPSIVDPRDVPSSINELSWRLGLYSLPKSTEIEELFKFVLENTSLVNFFSETSIDKRVFIGDIITKVHSRMFNILQDKIFVEGLTWLAFERAMFLSLETPEGFCRELMRNIAEMLKLRIEAIYETNLAIDEIIARMTNNKEFISLIIDIFIEDVSKLIIKSCIDLVRGENISETEILNQDRKSEENNENNEDQKEEGKEDTKEENEGEKKED